MFKKLIINILKLYISFFTSHFLYAQSLGEGQNPPTVKWRQINMKNFQIIYPTTFEREAQRMANTIQMLIPEVASSLKQQPRKISIILQNQGVLSNGFVTLAPRRSEFFTTPFQDFDSQDWLNSLAIHELRHAVQFDKIGGSLIKLPLFETLSGAILNIQVPSWFWEGDAVGIETALTHAGRGRLPSFELAFRTNVLSGAKYSYLKNYLGSMKDITSGYYPLGFFMTTKLRRDYGVEILDRILTRIKKNPFRLYNLSSTIKKYTGLNTTQLYDATVVELDSLWKHQMTKLNPVLYPRLNKRVDELPANYLLPVAISKTHILTLKQGQRLTPRFITIDSVGNETEVLNIGPQVVDNFNYNAGKIVWDEIRKDLRFQKRSFSVINLYDLTNKRYRQLTHRSRLFAPALSYDGKTIAAIDISYSNDISLVELDAHNGHEIKRYSNPKNYQLQAPQFKSDGTKIICVAVNKTGTALLEYDTTSGLTSQLTPFHHQQITHPVYAGNKILFKAHYNGVDNIYSLDPSTKKIIQLSSAPYGAFNPSYDSLTNRVLFNNYQIRGQDVASLKYEKNKGIAVEKLENTFIDFAKPLVLQEGNKNVFDTIPTKQYVSKSYRELYNPFYFYDIQPIWRNSIGAQVNSRDKLNVIDITSSYQYNKDLSSSEYMVGLTYKYWYPIFDLFYNNKKRLGYLKDNTPFTWREQNIDLGLTIPFAFNRLNQTYALNFKLTTSFTSRYDISLPIGSFATQEEFPLRYQIYFNRSTRISTMDLAPRWGQELNLSYRHFPFSDYLMNHILTLRSTFFVPGLWSNHSFSVRFNYQKGEGQYKSIIDIPRATGYSNLVPVANFTNTLLLAYHFPIAYPDLQISRLAYVRRLRGSFFSDFENVGLGNSSIPNTYGVTFSADMNLLRFDFLNSTLTGKLIFINQKSIRNPIFEFGINFSY